MTDLADYIQTYPDITSPTYQRDLYAKKEFNELRLTPFESKPERLGDLFNHQKLIKRLFADGSLVDRVLVVYEMGTGKTCAALAVAENFKRNGTKALYITHNQELVDSMRSELANKCTAGIYLPEETNITDRARSMRINKLIENYYEATSKDIFFRPVAQGGVFAKGNEAETERIKQKYSNRVIIIDEVHHYRFSSDSKKEQDVAKMRDALHWFLHTVENCRVLLMTGTPIVDQAYEIADIMNYMLPLDEQLPTRKNFDSTFFNPDGNIVNAEILYRAFHGRVVYSRRPTGNVSQYDHGVVADDDGEYTSVVPVVPIKMSDFQAEIMRKIMLERHSPNAEGSKRDAFLRNQRLASLLVFPTGEYNQEAFNSNVIKKQGNVYEFLRSQLVPLPARGVPQVRGGIAAILAARRKTTGVAPIPAPTPSAGVERAAPAERPIFKLRDAFNDVRTDEDKLRVLSKYSNKYAHVINEILTKRGVHFVYFASNVKGTGAIVFSLLLRMFGYTEYNRKLAANINDEKRYLIITSEHTLVGKTTAVLESFNRFDNRYGEKVQVIIGSEMASEGFTMYNVQYVHVMEPDWHIPGLSQAIARAVRLTSHDLLPVEHKVVNVYRYISIFANPLPNELPVDVRIYRLAEAKDFRNAQINRILKETDSFCPITYRRNVKSTDQEGSRECDYGACNYYCRTMDPDIDEEGYIAVEDGVWNYTIPENEIDDMGYNLQYGEEVILAIIEILVITFKYASVIAVEDIVQEFPQYNFILIARAIQQIISSRMILRDRYDFPAYLREHHGTLFLVRNVSDTNDIHNATYTRDVYSAYFISYHKRRRDEMLNDAGTVAAINAVISDPTDEDLYEMLGSHPLALFLEEMVINEAMIQDEIADVKKALFTKYLHKAPSGFLYHLLYLPDFLLTTYHKDNIQYKPYCLTRVYEPSVAEWRDINPIEDEELHKFYAANKRPVINNPTGIVGDAPEDPPIENVAQFGDINTVNSKEDVGDVVIEPSAQSEASRADEGETPRAESAAVAGPAEPPEDFPYRLRNKGNGWVLASKTSKGGWSRGQANAKNTMSAVVIQDLLRKLQWKFDMAAKKGDLFNALIFAMRSRGLVIES